MICQIAGEAPVEVAAFGSCFLDAVRELGDHDNVASTLSFPSGLVATIDVSRRCVYGYDQRIEVFGESGMLIAENQHATSVVSARKEGISKSPIEYSFPTRYRAAYQNEMECFLDCVRGKRTVPITHAEVQLNHLLATALELAARERRVVRLSELG
jgi:myo-inositol 2-dehydrogenase/D-chiro-inositol 1-dehydrogenase